MFLSTKTVHSICVPEVHEEHLRHNFLPATCFRSPVQSTAYNATLAGSIMRHMNVEKHNSGLELKLNTTSDQSITRK